MHLGCLMLTLLRAIVAVEGWSVFSAVTDVWRSIVGDPCPQRLIMAKFVRGLRSNLKNELFGQHLVHDKLVAMVESHLSRDPPKPLVISMHGWTGGGKNHATKILIDTLYEKGLGNQHVHFFSGRLDFPLATTQAINEYKVNLHNWIRGNVSACESSTFIFDEIDKVPSEVIDSVKPFLDYHTALNKVDYRKSIFIFISNVGGNVITKRYLELWESGVSRSNMEYKSFETVLRNVLYNTEGAFKKSSILEDHLVSLYLPFLPLEKEHIELCIRREMQAQKVTVAEDKIEQVLDAMEFYKDRLSVSGCKRVSDQVAMLKYRYVDEL